MNGTYQDALSPLLKDQAARCFRNWHPVTGRFLTPTQQSEAIRFARLEMVNAGFEGGFENAERRQVCFYPQDAQPVFRQVWVEIRWNTRFSNIDHRALLGSLMALGTDRSFYGDLVVGTGSAWLRTFPETAEQLPYLWSSAGNDPIHVRVMSSDEVPILPDHQGQTCRIVVASPRADAILSEAMHISRGKAADHIRDGLMLVNHMPEEKIDRLLREGNILSVRGFGRIEIRSIDSPNKKGKIPVEIEVFSRKSK